MRTEVGWTEKRFLDISFYNNVLGGLFFITSTIYASSTSAGLFVTFLTFMVSTAVWEVLTGAYADIFSRRSAIVGSFILHAGAGILFLGYFLAGQKVGSSKLWLMGISAYALADALMSGSVDAWLHDRRQFFSGASDLTSVYTRMSVRSVLGTTVGYFAGLTMVLLIFWSPLDSMATPVALSGVIILLGLSLSYWNRRLPEEYWASSSYHQHVSIISYIKKYLSLLFLDQRYLYYTVFFASLWATWMIYSFTIWPFLLPGNGGAYEWQTKEIVIGAAFATVSSIGAWMGPNLVKRFKLNEDSTQDARVSFLIVAAAVNFTPLLILGMLGLLSDGWLRSANRAWAIIAGMFVFRIGLVALQAAVKSINQAIIKENAHRATLISNTTAWGYLFAAVLSIVVMQIWPTEDLNIPLNWVAFVIVSFISIAFIAIEIRISAKRTLHGEELSAKRTLHEEEL